MSSGLLFPGQGSQFVGMGQSLARRFPEARDVFEEADDILCLALSRLAWEGPPDLLTATEHAQPALYVHSLAAYRVIRDRIGSVGAAVGHSLGELTAHGAAGTYSFADGLRLVRLRGKLMARAGEAAPGAMAAVIGLSADSVAALCREAADTGMTVVPANLNSVSQIVVSGDLAGVEWLCSAAKASGAKRAVPLPVSAAFHSPLMRPAAEKFRERLDDTALTSPSFPVVSNVTAEVEGDPDRIRRLLVRQLTSPVRWIECVARARAAGVTRFLELGPGRVLTGLNRRNAKGVPTTAMGEPDSIASMEEWI